MQRAQEILEKTFGYAEFRLEQAQIIGALIEGRDVMALMPTGGGKSLCYQIPALVRDGVAVVVSPLIALMQDQVDALQTPWHQGGLSQFNAHAARAPAGRNDLTSVANLI